MRELCKEDMILIVAVMKKVLQGYVWQPQLIIFSSISSPSMGEELVQLMKM